MGLSEYRRKRDFHRTPEPEGGERPASARGLFVVQKHAASRLHYDFRLESGGVLKSWAVPKGPSLDPHERRLAVEVEDHPVEYGSFEGIIPPGEYGGGTVLLWDRGHWIPDGDPQEGFRRGRLSFRLEGEKLKGAWQLVRMGGSAPESGKPQWLLLKRKDADARPAADGDVLQERPESVVSGRSLDEIARRADRVWTRSGGESAPVVPEGARRAPMPRSVEPVQATLVTEAPAGADWLHEVKFDGYRVLARREKGRVRLLTRRQQDWTGRFPHLAAAVAALPVETALLDGEVVALDAEGRSDFQALQHALSDGRTDGLWYCVFDLLYLDGHDLRDVPLEARKGALAPLLARVSPDGPLRYSDHVVGGGRDFHREACRLALEGVVSKRVAAPYRAGRSRDWLKVKCIAEQEFVIAGYTDPSGERVGLGSLLLGVHDTGGLRYAGKVGTGFDRRMLQRLKRRLATLERPRSPFHVPPPAADARGAHWVAPEMVVAVAFSEWTRDGRLRHPRFLGLREDKDPREVRRERPDSGPPGATSEDDGAPGVTITHPDRVLYPRQGLTKADLVAYYGVVGRWTFAHVVDRPLTLVRCPRGTTAPCFFQKHAQGDAPPGLTIAKIEERSGRKAPYFVVRELRGLAALVQIGALEVHVGGSRAGAFEKPDRIVFDIDPDPALPWSQVVETAWRLRERLTDLGLESWAKTTGGKGLHLVVPVVPRYTWDVVEGFARAVARGLAEEEPARYTLEAAKARRRGRIFLDYLRNGRGATAVAPFSPRARDGAPVAAPVSWDEVTASLRPAELNVQSIPARLERLRVDPWEGLDTSRQALTVAMLRRLGVQAE